MSPELVPDEGGFRAAHFTAYFNQSLAELEKLAASGNLLLIEWPKPAVLKLNEWSQAGKAPHKYRRSIVAAARIATPPQVHGIVDAIRTKALDLALGLRKELPEAGEASGLSVGDNLTVARAATNIFQTNIYGGTNNLGIGGNVRQELKADRGDIEGLLAALQQLGVGREDREALRGELVGADEAARVEKSKKWLGRLTDGGVSLAGAVVTPLVVAAAKHLFTTFTGIPIP